MLVKLVAFGFDIFFRIDKEGDSDCYDELFLLLNFSLSWLSFIQVFANMAFVDRGIARTDSYLIFG